ncbi:rRNA biogenesis protein rrp36 [Penicillium canariense]|uniref:rRNA biogenesis protein RRP36 n=1 Tax=Penicillium canariense TaxID=189055 RepID=A0A9W9LMR0_9EURO|nr:rRNA biogenesis protein rrp36 [Penicillium canariense]KAJ5166361.1 rRNA biogenesis protein rrp36 [Penicillium canariense]
MAISDLLNRRVVRARHDDEDELNSDESGMGEELSQDEAEQDGDSDAEDVQSDDSQKAEESEDDEDTEGGNDNASEEASSEEEDSDLGNDDIQASLSNISFGALAKAQATMGPKKRKEKANKLATESASTASPLDDIRARIRSAREQTREAAAKSTPASKEAAKEKKAARASKHAPMVQSSKYAVTRRRTVVEPPAVPKARDPRFDAAVMGHSGKGPNAQAAEKNYAFLDEYRASELKDLKRQMAMMKNPEAKEALKKQIRSATDQKKSRDNRKREETVIAEHKQREKQAIREGKKSTPYYLKKSDLKKQVLQKKYEEMGSRDRTKALERRRKKMASKERKEMPMERRGMEGMGDEPPARGGKRRRLE